MVDLVTDHPCCDNPNCECMGETWEDHVDTLTIERDRFKGQREAMHRRAQKAEGEAARLRKQLTEARNDALEEAVQAVHEECWTDDVHSGSHFEQSTTRMAIRAIRALKGGAQ